MGRKRKTFVPIPRSDYINTNWLTVAEIAKHWGKHRTSVTNRIAELACVKPGHDYLISEKSVRRIWGKPKTHHKTLAYGSFHPQTWL